MDDASVDAALSDLNTRVCQPVDRKTRMKASAADDERGPQCAVQPTR
jgi:hypothetical protein